MIKLEQLQPKAAVRGIVPDALVVVVNVQWFGSEALELTYKTPVGKLANELLYRHDEPRLEIVEQGRPWSFDGDGALFRLVSEAQRIRLAHLFDPVLAVHTSVVEPLPHQITAVYEAMLPRQPLRFLLADDPGAGKTIMAGLLVKELIARGDLQRCLIVCPGSLAEQWQDELFRRFHLPFEILTNDKLEAARTGNWFLETNLVIARLDKLSRNEDVQQKLQAPDCRWDLVVCDEAHKMAATVFGGETKYTKRYKLGQLLSGLTRHFLLMSATPHNGKEADFQLFMALLDGDRFEGRYRDGVHVVDVSDLMRRMVKESLLKFDGTPLFPERIAYTVQYKLSEAEAHLYKAVTEYVRDEFDRAAALENDKRAGTVGFALTVLQRRLASSPEAIFQSLRRRRERLESRLRELEVLQRAGQQAPILTPGVRALDAEDVEDLEDAPDNEVESVEEEILDQATAARTIGELKIEIGTLKELESYALTVCQSGTDTKWRELAGLLGQIFTTPAAAQTEAWGSRPGVLHATGDIPAPKPSPRQKLVLFTEHRDTLNYLERKIGTMLGDGAVVTIHGGMGREERMKAQETFKHDPEVKVLLATDAAGEGINLQRAHLMVNYDLPWNPNRLEQRFGAGKPNAKLNSAEARKRADNLQGRLQKRLEDLKLEAQISPLPPVVLGGILVVPAGLLAAMGAMAAPTSALPADTQASAARARAIVMEVERGLGFEPTDREFEKLGYDIESRVPGTGKLRFIEVKGRVTGAPTVTVTRNEILYSLNKPEDFILAIVEFLDADSHRVHYLREPFKREPDFGVTSVDYDLVDLLGRAEAPR